MLLYESKHTEGKLEIVTRAYLDEEGETTMLTLYQYLFDGGEVVSSSEVSLSTEQVGKIVNIFLETKSKQILNEYKLEQEGLE
jgi:hypothetical protein